MTQVLVEVLPNIQACNLYITLPTDRGPCLEITADKYLCIIKLRNGDGLTIKFPKGTSLVPGTVSKITQDGSHITARAQLDEKTSLLSTLSADLLSTVGPAISDTSPTFSEILKDSLVSAQCKQCRRVLLSDVRFRRVLPLPSVDWDQSSEGWFCHLHGSEGEKLKPSSLQPARDDCFYSELHFLVHKDTTVDCVSPNNNNCELACCGCQASLGVRSKQSVLKLWAHSLMWVRSEDNQIVFGKDVSGILLSLIHNIDKDNFGVNCRLVLEVSHEEEAAAEPEFLYLVTMNTNQKLLLPEKLALSGTSDKKYSLSVNSDKMEADNLASNKSFPSEKRPRVHQDDISEVILRRVYTIKLLYLFKRGQDDITGSWIDDVNVHILPCTRSFLLEVKAVLEASVACLPQAMRRVENMSVGYIVKNA
ncbi:E3 ubiquitin-protein ligase E3D-like [Penaeus monodon]|uniref:E3 ubiquitin-protein ligase E3D-like n=1 Tax=Penaeus monodon TaxID=6687 RepID=UPI0018A76830|nr:E3 ubiquitin-protein ligase E3D-like [Penaeus monodon]XP_037794675.1 E3 ubiquitin-protein ligase E3D-like [Penaeus monodon]